MILCLSLPFLTHTHTVHEDLFIGLLFSILFNVGPGLCLLNTFLSLHWTELPHGRPFSPPFLSPWLLPKEKKNILHHASTSLYFFLEAETKLTENFFFKSIIYIASFKLRTFTLQFVLHPVVSTNIYVFPFHSFL